MELRILRVRQRRGFVCLASFGAIPSNTMTITSHASFSSLCFPHGQFFGSLFPPAQKEKQQMNIELNGPMAAQWTDFPSPLQQSRLSVPFGFFSFKSILCWNGKNTS
jgi:hypothetical protein